MKSAKVVVDRLIAAQQRENDGKYPETIAVVLWGTDNIKTYGESLAQVMWMVGVRPVPDALGRVNKVQLIPLEELGRPRIDVVVNCSGVFRTHPRSAFFVSSSPRDHFHFDGRGRWRTRLVLGKMFFCIISKLPPPTNFPQFFSFVFIGHLWLLNFE